MRDRTALAAIFFAAALVAVGFSLSTSEPPASATPDVEFAVESDASAGELTVEHAGGDSVESGSIRVLVYEDRPIVPDRTVHGTLWKTDSELILPGDRLELEDRRFAFGQRVVVRWFGDDGQTTLQESTI